MLSLDIGMEKLFDEITNELHLVEDTICTLNGTPIR